jgi:flagellar motor switch protein FliN/FliY
MSTDSAAPVADFGPFGAIPKLTGRQVVQETLLAREGGRSRFRDAFGWLFTLLDRDVSIGPVEVFWRAAGRGRPGAIAQISWPEQQTRVAFGLENALAHAIVDRLLGFERFAGEERLQVTPVEWGVLTYAAARSLAHLGEPAGLILDRLGPEPFPIDGLGPVATLRWSVRVGACVGSARLWVPESLLEAELSRLGAPMASHSDSDVLFSRFRLLGSTWRALAGTVTCFDGIRADLVGRVLPIDGSRLAGGSGPIELVSNRFGMPATLDSASGGPVATIVGPLTPLEIPPMSPPTDTSPTDVPITLTVELGKINMPLEQLADLKPGMTLSLLRHAREPVELTSAGRLVARGELVQIDDVLGVRILNVLL